MASPGSDKIAHASDSGKNTSPFPSDQVHNRNRMVVDWGTAKADYLLHPDLTLGALVEKYGINASYLRSVALREH